MYAIAFEDNNAVWRSQDDPVPASHEIVIRNYAAGINRADLIQRAGFYPAPPGASEIPGLECAGVVSAIGNSVTQFAVGDRVCALLAGGGYAEQVLVDARHALVIPEQLDFIQAAALPEVFATAYLNIYIEAKAAKGESVLVHAGASGVGTAAIQICKALGNPVYVTVGSEQKRQQCMALGALDAHDRKQGGFASSAMVWTDNKGFDVILDPVGASYLADNISCLNLDGRLVLIGLMGGGQADINLASLLLKRQRVIGSTLRSRSADFKADLISLLAKNIWSLIISGEIKPIVEKAFAIKDIDQAHQLLESNQTFGKLILTIDQ